MKKSIVIFLFLFSTILAFAQSESVAPTLGVAIEREVYSAVIENKLYENVTVELKAADLLDLAGGVKVIITDTETGERIYKKRFPRSYLYALDEVIVELHLPKSYYVNLSLMGIGQSS